MSKPKPVHEIRLGTIKATVWRNTDGENGPHYNTTLGRIYRKDDEWKTTTSFGRDDLLAAAKVADLAHTWICEHQEVPSKAAAAARTGR